MTLVESADVDAPGIPLRQVASLAESPTLVIPPSMSTIPAVALAEHSDGEQPQPEDEEDQAAERRARLQEQIAILIGSQRAEEALAAKRLGHMQNWNRVRLLRTNMMLAAARHCRLQPQADTRLAILIYIHFLSDNEFGICRLSITRMCRIFGRSRETIGSSIESLERGGQIGVIRSRGGHQPSCYWPLVHPRLAELDPHPVWLLDAMDPPSEGAQGPRSPDPSEGAQGPRSPDPSEGAQGPRSPDRWGVQESRIVDPGVRDRRSLTSLKTSSDLSPQPPKRARRARGARERGKVNSDLDVDALIAELRKEPDWADATTFLIEPVLRQRKFVAPDPAYTVKAVAEWAAGQSVEVLKAAAFKVLEARYAQVDGEHFVAAVRKVTGDVGQAPKLSRPGAKAGVADGLVTITEKEQPEAFAAWAAHHETRQKEHKPNKMTQMSLHRFVREATLYPPPAPPESAW